MITYTALLRGINLGGHNKVGMDDLRRLFVGLGHCDVQTYLRSGNVLFGSPVEQPELLARDIESRIAQDLDVDVNVLLRTVDDLADVLAANPFLGQETDFAKLHVTFLADVPDPERTARFDAPAGVPDSFSVVAREVYLHCPDGYGRSKLTNAYIEKRLGVAATTRNWRTVTKLRDLTHGLTHGERI